MRGCLGGQKPEAAGKSRRDALQIPASERTIRAHHFKKTNKEYRNV